WQRSLCRQTRFTWQPLPRRSRATNWLLFRSSNGNLAPFAFRPVADDGAGPSSSAASALDWRLLGWLLRRRQSFRRRLPWCPIRRRRNQIFQMNFSRRAEELGKFGAQIRHQIAATQRLIRPDDGRQLLLLGFDEDRSGVQQIARREQHID